MLCAIGRDEGVLDEFREFGIGDFVPEACFIGVADDLTFRFLLLLPKEFLCNIAQKYTHNSLVTKN